MRPFWRRAAALATAAATLLDAAPSRAGAKLDVSNERIVFVCFEPNPATGYDRRPGCSGYGERAGRRVLMSYNSLGLRDKDYPAKPAPGIVRVLATGGSIVTGSGLEEKDSPPRALERGLRRLGLKAEVIDASEEGFTGWQTAVALPRFLDAYSPQAVVYYFPSHHVFTDRSWWPRLRLADGRVAGMLPFLGFLRFLPERWRPAAAQRLGPLLFIYREQWDRIRASWHLALIRDPSRRFDDLMAPTLAILRQMNDDCRSRGVRFFVAYGPQEVNADYYVLPRRPPLVVRLEQRLLVLQFRFDGPLVEERLRGAGLELLPLDRVEPALEAAQNRLPGDYHWNERGAALFGEAVAGGFAAAWKPSVRK